MEAKYSILIVDDDSFMRDACKQTLTKRGHSVTLAKSGREALKLLEEWSFDLILLDLKMPGEDGLFVLARIKDMDPEASVVMITGHGTIETAVQAIKLGAFDFISKPFTPDELLRLVDRVLKNRRLTIENIYLRQTLERERRGSKEIISKSPAMAKVKEMIAMVARTDSTVMLQGESGTGKGLVARRIHELSARRNYPFIPVDCGSLVKTLFESQLFGHVKGAFTGATSTRAGQFELAHGGTLFFDEISNIGLEVQAKLLRAVEEKCISKVGDHKVVKVDVRLISATNRDLQEAVARGVFREDLFYRLNVVSIHLPPLRERKEEIPLLANHFVKVFSQKQGKRIDGISKDAMKALMEYNWPGNVRELENTIERLIVFARGRTITPEDLIYSNTIVPRTEISEPMRLDEVEQQHIMRVFSSVGGNKTRAAELLGIDRKTLRAKLKKYEISSPGD
ncbi:MAG: sigma-54-dependent Fis family transcriptional regulator [Deltaproteobacteria bacterium]|nr:sigma-54-dependent Fis family transcriptional regulator [Deltaproteobacteria bacterium]